MAMLVLLFLGRTRLYCTGSLYPSKQELLFAKFLMIKSETFEIMIKKNISGNNSHNYYTNILHLYLKV